MSNGRGKKETARSAEKSRDLKQITVTNTLGLNILLLP